MADVAVKEGTLLQGSINNYASAMRKLINNKEFSDVKFVVGHQKKSADNESAGPKGDNPVECNSQGDRAAQTIYAHQSILAAHCTVFKAMFLDPDCSQGEKMFELPDMRPCIFLAMLEYIYTNTVRLDSAIAIDVLASALEYGLDDLRDLCVEYVIKNLTVSNACDVMQTAVTYNQNDLKEMAMNYIEKNTKDVLLSESFTYISQDALVSILRSSKLAIDETDIIQAVRAWASVCCKQANGESICDVGREAIKQLRLALLSPRELDVLEEENRGDHFIPGDLLSQARALLKDYQQGKQGNVLCTKREGTRHRDHH